jgi:hypothetical protein
VTPTHPASTSPQGHAPSWRGKAPLSTDGSQVLLRSRQPIHRLTGPPGPPKCNLKLQGLPLHQSPLSETPSDDDYYGHVIEIPGTRAPVIPLKTGPPGTGGDIGANG